MKDKHEKVGLAIFLTIFFTIFEIIFTASFVGVTPKMYCQASPEGVVSLVLIAGLLSVILTHPSD